MAISGPMKCQLLSSSGLCHAGALRCFPLNNNEEAAGCKLKTVKPEPAFCGVTPVNHLKEPPKQSHSQLEVAGKT